MGRCTLVEVLCASRERVHVKNRISIVANTVRLLQVFIFHFDARRSYLRVSRIWPIDAADASALIILIAPSKLSNAFTR